MKRIQGDGKAIHERFRGFSGHVQADAKSVFSLLFADVNELEQEAPDLGYDARQRAHVGPNAAKNGPTARPVQLAVAGEVIELTDLHTQIHASIDQASPVRAVRWQAGHAMTSSRSLPDRVRAFEIEIIREAIEETRGNQAQAARMLGVPRRTLTNKVHAYGLIA